jgi:hypothetical protein
MTTRFKFDGYRGDPRIDWITDDERYQRIEFDWKTEELIFLCDDDAIAYSLKFNERPCVTFASDS